MFGVQFIWFSSLLCHLSSPVTSDQSRCCVCGRTQWIHREGVCVPALLSPPHPLAALLLVSRGFAAHEIQFTATKIQRACSQAKNSVRMWIILRYLLLGFCFRYCELCNHRFAFKPSKYDSFAALVRILCSSRKYPYLPYKGSVEIPRGIGGGKRKVWS